MRCTGSRCRHLCSFLKGCLQASHNVQQAHLPGLHSPSYSEKSGSSAPGIAAACCVFACSHVGADGQNGLLCCVVQAYVAWWLVAACSSVQHSCEREACHVHGREPASLLAHKFELGFHGCQWHGSALITQFGAAAHQHTLSALQALQVLQPQGPMCPSRRLWCLGLTLQHRQRPSLPARPSARLPWWCQRLTRRSHSCPRRAQSPKWA